jgi:hypothetical protein
MEVKVITAGISYSLQLETGTWKKIELGASAEVDPKEPWPDAQVALYKCLKHQLATIWPASERQPVAPTSPATPALTPPAEAECPHHGKAKDSRDGKTLYCPSKMADGTYCQWTTAK